MVVPAQSLPKYAEFFCGGGMVRAALDGRWDCVLANDIDPMKCDVYRTNWGDAGVTLGDVADLPVDLLKHPIDLFWGSSPCQDFSLAGKGQGLSGARGGVFSAWAAKISEAVAEGAAPRIIAFENVAGLVSRNKGADFTKVVKTLTALGYRVGALEIDAAAFLPQSRPRLFVVCIRNDLAIAPLRDTGPGGVFHSRRLRDFVRNAPRWLRQNWVWFRHEPPLVNRPALADLIDDTPDTPWLNVTEIRKLTSLMSPPSKARIAAARKTGHPEIGMLYKRGRPDGQGTTHQRAEVRFDGLAGCLRTPGGGSSRQTVLFIEGRKTRARLLSSREAARLMGLADDFQMPPRYNQAYKVAGDGVVVPAVAYLDAQIFQPALRLSKLEAAA